MDAYIYQADLFCEDCGLAIREEIAAAHAAPDDPDDEHSYDSDEYPKGPYSDGGGESDHPQHCGNHSDCINALDIGDGFKVGAPLENPLTTDGIEYVMELIRTDPDNTVVQLWQRIYADELPSIDDE